MISYRRVGFGGLGVIMGLSVLGAFLFSAPVVQAATQYALDCASCHTMPPSDSSDGSRDPLTGAFKGNHQTHAGATAATCAKCHGPGVLTATGHRDKTIQVSGNINSSPVVASYSRAGFFNQTSIPPVPLGTCSSVNCHFESVTPAWGEATFASPASCGQCHGSPPNDGSHPAASGSGKKHGDYYGTGTGSCGKCHPDHTLANPFAHATSAGKRSLILQFTAAPNSGGSYSKAANLAYPAYLPSQTVPANRNGSCSSMYCHSDGASGGPNTTPVWGGSLPADCSGCHGGDATAGTKITSNKHAQHTDNSALLGANYGCVECHAKTVSNNTTIAIIANHVNGLDNYSGAKAYKSGYTVGSLTTCITYCHSSGKKGLSIGGVTVEPAAVSWNAVTNDLTCKGCHGAASGGTSFPSQAGEPNYPSQGANVAGSNSHQKHVGTTGAATTCINCHSDTVDGAGALKAGVKHTDRTVDVINGNSKTFGWDANKTCSNISCHSNGKFTAGNAQWGASLDCKGCHATLSGAHTRHTGALNWASLPFYNYTANLSSGSDTNGVTWQSYAFGCANCHPVSTAKHIDGFVDVEMNTVSGGSTLRNKNSSAGTTGTIGVGDLKCSNVYCHSSTETPQWSQTFTAATRCSGCHGNSPAGDSHASHAVGIHYNRIFSGTSGKLPASGAVGINAGHGDPAQSTTISCRLCHVNTVNYDRNKYNSSCSTVSCHGNATGNNADATGAARITNLANHVNGFKDVVFAGTTMKSKAQVDTPSFSNYTAGTGGWTFTGRNFKSGVSGFDTAKNPLTSGTYTSGNCSNISCHNGLSVHWTNDLGKGVKCAICHTRL